jgi:hypothetical protein
MAAPLTELDKRLQQIALMNWTQFVSIIGEDAIMSAKICLLRQEDKKSYGEIAVKLGVTEKKARYWCGECEVKG